MRHNAEGDILLEQDDIVDSSVDPNLSGSGFQCVRDGDGDDSTFVKLFGFGTGDPTVVRAKQGALIRPVPGDEHTAEEKANLRSWVSVVNGDGWKVPLGQWPEDTRTLTSNDPIPA